MDNKTIRYYHQNTKNNLVVGEQDICKSPMNLPVSNLLTAKRKKKYFYKAKIWQSPS